MKTKYLLFLVILLAMGGSLFAQDGIPVKNLYGSGVPNANLAHIVGTTYVDQSTSPATVYTCTAVTLSNTVSQCTWVSAGSSSSSPSPVNSQFFISNVACGGATNCLQMVDDDATDNCGAALTTWLGLVNAYAGPGKPQVTIYGSGAGKAYKLATANCELSFTLTKGANVHLLATIDCAQSGTDCIRFAPTGQGATVLNEDYTLDGSGVIFGGASLTTSCSPACAGILLEPGINNFAIRDVQFQGPIGGTTNGGFGANNATMGNCTNYLIYIANPIADGYVQNTRGAVTSSSSTVGGCGYANPNGAAAGTNTVKFIDNVVGTIGFSGGAGACGSVGIIDGGSYGTSGENVIYGFGMPIRVQGQGHIIRHNEIDNAQCAASGLTAAINVGAAASSATVPGINIDGNIVQGGSNHTIDLLAIAGDSTATITGASIQHNQTSGASTANLFHTNTGCIANVGQGNLCTISGNINLLNQFSAANTANGWSWSLNLAGTNSAAAQGANLAFTQLTLVPTSRTYIGWCQVIETTADGVSSTLPSCQFKYTDVTTGVLVTRTVSATNTGNTVGTISDGYTVLGVLAGGQVQYGTTGYLSNTASQMKYTVIGYIATY